jgi:uncharacterized protein
VILYVDTSALLKLFMPEPHGDDVRLWTDAAEALVTAAITLPEMVSAVSRRRRAGDLSETHASELVRQLKERWPSYMRTALDEDLAADLAWRHGLRGMDAVHLATACALQTAVGPDGLAFAAFDDQLNRAAAAEGLIVLHPSG